MNRPAIDDLLGTILSTWYESVAEWMPPGQLSAATCTACHNTGLAGVVDASRWPHDLMHQLVMSLDSALRNIAGAPEVGADPFVTQGSVRYIVMSEMIARTAEIEDVLEQCISPRLDDWISRQAISLTPHLRG